MILPPNDNGALNWMTDPSKSKEREALIRALVEFEKVGTI